MQPSRAAASPLKPTYLAGGGGRDYAAGGKPVTDIKRSPAPAVWQVRGFLRATPRGARGAENLPLGGPHLCATARRGF